MRGKIISTNFVKNTVHLIVCDSTKQFWTIECEAAKLVPNCFVESHDVWWSLNNIYYDHHSLPIIKIVKYQYLTLVKNNA